MKNLSEELRNSLIGSRKVSLSNLAKYTFDNDLQCMGEDFFNTGDIKRALLLLKAVNAGDPYKFMNSSRLRTHPPSLNAPSPNGLDNIPLDSFEKVTSPDDEIGVIFNDVQFVITPLDSTPEKWFHYLHSDFLPRIKHSPTFLGARYFYYGKENNFEVDTSLVEKKGKHIGQIFADLIGNALWAYSCCRKIDFGCSRFLEGNTLPDDSTKSVWDGNLGDFINSAEIIEGAIGEMREGNYRSGRNAGNETRIMLAHSEGVVLMTDKSQQYHDLLLVGGKFESKCMTLPQTMIFGKRALELMQEDKSILR